MQGLVATRGPTRRTADACEVVTRGTQTNPTRLTTIAVTHGNRVPEESDETTVRSMEATVSTPFPELDGGPEVGLSIDEINRILSSPVVESYPLKTAIEESPIIDTDEEEN